MSELFLKIINMSISASWLVLVVLILRFVLKKAPRWINVMLWGIVAIRLICPFSIESAFSLIPSAETIPMNIEMAANPAIDSGINIVNNVINPVVSATFTPNPATSANPLQIWIPVASFLWITGMVVLLFYTVISYCRLRCKVDTAVLYKNNIFQSENVASPFVLGIMKPRIYLPFNIDEQDLEYVVAHEQAHIRRNDHLWKPLGFLLLTLHWFNPLMWVAYVLLCRDIELACDEKVIKELGNEQRADYTQALVACSVNRRMIAACPLAFGEVGVKERVKSVMNYKKPAFWMIVIAVISCVVVAVCFLTNPKQDRYTLQIVVPAGSQEPFVYTDEEISTIGDSIKIWSGDGLGDTSVLLSPVNETTETGYVAEYLTHGMPVEFDAEKDTWFKVGVGIQNPTDEDIIVYVEVENVEVRISEQLGSEDGGEWITEEINIEKRDITHDGVEDYIVTSMSYDTSILDRSVSLEERIEQQIFYDIISVKIYEGQQNADTYREENLLWSQDYSRVHTGNGQLSIVQVNGKDYLLTSSLYGGQGYATWNYEVFSLNSAGEKNMIDEQSVEFEMNTEDSKESVDEFKSLIGNYIDDGILIVACDIDFEEQLIRTKENSYCPQNYYEYAFAKYDDTQSGEVQQQEPYGNIAEVQRELERVVCDIGLENAFSWNNTVELKPDADALIKMASDETERFEIYGIMSEKYGTYGLLLNDWIDGEQNWNYAYVPWVYTGAPSEQPILELDETGNYVFAYVYKYDDVPLWKEYILDCGYDTGHMELILGKEIATPAAGLRW